MRVKICCWIGVIFEKILLVLFLQINTIIEKVDREVLMRHNCKLALTLEDTHFC